MKLEMTITQGDNGWVLEYIGHDCLDKMVITTRWEKVIKEANDYFGWYDISGKQSKRINNDNRNNSL